MKTALITGITGQDGSYMAELLLEKGYKVCGLVRHSSLQGQERIAHLLDDIELLSGDLLDQGSLINVLTRCQPDEVYNLAAQSFVPTSWAQPVFTSEVTAVGAVKLLEAIRVVAPEARFYQASSSEMYGKVREVPQSETTPFHPRSPYACSKAYAHYATVNYRESFGMYAVSGICFNHESPRRGTHFVTRKVTHAVARIKYGLQDKLAMGNLESSRDWGFAGDYVRAMWLMLQQPAADDFVIAAGKTHSVRELLSAAFGYAGLIPEDYVIIDSELFRPAEVDLLIGDPSKAKAHLGWAPKLDFRDLIEMMVEHDLRLVRDTMVQSRAAVAVR